MCIVDRPGADAEALDTQNVARAGAGDRNGVEIVIDVDKAKLLIVLAKLRPRRHPREHCGRSPAQLDVL